MLDFPLKKVSELDSLITNLHSELASLYQERSELIEAANPKQLSLDAIRNPWAEFVANETPQAWVEKEHQKLIDIWSIYGFDVPSPEKLKGKLLKCREVINNLSAAKPELRDRLEVVLVPPAKLIGSPLKPELREIQAFVKDSDEININLPQTKSRKWRLLVVYNAEAGLYLDMPKRIIKDKLYMIGDYDTRALGAQEYMAFSLQRIEPTDTTTWALLLKNYSKGDQVPVVNFGGGRYRFDFDEITTVFGDIRFRPAVEIE